MPQTQHATRRGLLAGVAVLPAVVAAPAIAAARGSLAALWAKRAAMLDTPGLLADESPAGEAVLSHYLDLGRNILAGPIACRSDAATKARMLLEVIGSGDLLDKRDEGAARQLTAWLERG